MDIEEPQTLQQHVARFAKTVKGSRRLRFKRLAMEMSRRQDLSELIESWATDRAAFFDAEPQDLLQVLLEGSTLATAMEEFFRMPNGSLAGTPVDDLIPKAFGRPRAWDDAFLESLVG